MLEGNAWDDGVREKGKKWPLLVDSPRAETGVGIRLGSGRERLTWGIGIGREKQVAADVVVSVS